MIDYRPLLFAALLALGGCAPPPYAKPGASAADLDQAILACRVSSGFAPANEHQKEALFGQCMNEAGWRRG